jgi:predicted transcriptional regulator
MVATNVEKFIRTTDGAKMELYKLIGEGLQAIQTGQVCTIEEVRDELDRRRTQRG